jgi:hypothetical protein
MNVRIRRLFLAIALLCLTAQLSVAQYRFEITPHVGYRWGGSLDSHNSASPTVPAATLYDKLSVQGSVSYGVGGGYYVSPSLMLDFDWMRQGTAIDARRITGITDKSLADFTMNTYHFGFNYFISEPEAKMRPYIRVGLGWTASRPEVNGVNTFNRFSAAIGGGLKYYIHRNFGVGAQIQYMPAYVYSNTDGFWCGWYGCWTTSNSHYLHQGDVSLMFSFRF